MKTVQLLGLSMVVLLGADLFGKDEVEKEAIAAAERWLQLVDAGQYGESWKQAAARFRESIDQAGWEARMKRIRQPLGSLKSRRVWASEYTEFQPEAPKGEYVVIQFKTSFANCADGIETVIPMKDDDGVWRVSGYYIR